MTMPQDTVSTTPQPRRNVAATDTALPDTRSESSEYWVARVVRRMHGCTPSKIDSVIQANMPRREIRWSQRQDTLDIPGLEGKLPYTLPDLKREYDQGFFKGNKFLHPELPVRQYGIATEPLAQPQLHHDLLLAMVILCLAMVSVLVNSTRRFLQMRAKDFFYTAANSNESSQHDKDIPLPGTIFATYMLLCITGGLFALYYAQSTRNLLLCVIPLHGLLAVYAGCFAMMFLAKRLLSVFINWIFFNKGSRRLWYLDYNFLLIAETVVLLPIVAAGICFGIPAKLTLLAGLAVVATAKILLLYKAFAIFIPKFYCFLHLLSYLCGLEIMPFLALWVTLHSVTDYLTITF